MTRLTAVLALLLAVAAFADDIPDGPSVTALCPETQPISGRCIGVAPQTQCNPTFVLDCEPPLAVQTYDTAGCASGFSCSFRACCK